MQNPDIEVEVTSRTLVVDNQGATHLTWRATVPVPGGSVYGAYHQCLEGDMAWREADVLSGEDEAGAPIVAVGVDTPLALAWNMAGAEAEIHMGLWEGCTLVLQAKMPMQSRGLTALAIGGEPQRICGLVSAGQQTTWQAVCARLPTR